MSLQERDLFKTLSRVLYLAAALAILIWFLYLIERILLASLLALILAVALNGPVTWLEKRNVPRAVGTLLSFLVVLAMSALVGWLIIPRLVDEIPALIEQVPDLIDSLVAQVTAVLGDHPEVQQQMMRVVDWVLGVFDGLWRYTDRLIGALALGLFVVALALYMIVNLRSMLGWYLRSMPPHRRDQATRAFARASGMVIGWVAATVILGGIKAVAVFVFLSLVGIPGAVVWSVLGFFGAFIPRIGFYFTTIPPVVVAFGIDPLLALWTFIYYAAFSELLGNFVAPWIYGETMKLSAVFVLFMTLAMGYAFGVVGVLIATPVAGFIKAYYDEFYLATQPEVSKLEERVDAMIARDPDRVGASEG